MFKMPDIVADKKNRSHGEEFAALIKAPVFVLKGRVGKEERNPPPRNLVEVDGNLINCIQH